MELNTNTKLKEIIKHLHGNLQNLTEWFSGEKLEELLTRKYIDFLWHYFGVTKNHTSAEFTLIYPSDLGVKRAAAIMNEKLLDLEFMEKFVMTQLEFRKNKDPKAIERGIRNYKKYYGLI